METTVYRVYSLRDPRDGRTRYVGITKQTLERRFQQHCYVAACGSRYSIGRWIKKLSDAGLKPTIHLLEETTDCVRERFWINAHRAQGDELLNISEAVYGIHTHICSDETRRRLSVSRKGKKMGPRPEEWRRKIGDAHRGRTLPREQVEKTRLANLGRKATPEARRRMSEARIGKKHTKELCEKISKGLRGKPKSEEHRKNIAARDRSIYRPPRGDDHPWRKRPELVMRGESQPTSRLTEVQVRAMRREYDAGGISVMTLGRKYGVAHSTCHRVVKRISWQHID